MHYRVREILVADRDEPWCMAVSEALAARGYRCARALGAEAARWEVRQTAFDLVVLSTSLGDWAIKGLMSDFVAARSLPLLVVVVAPPHEGPSRAPGFVPADRVLRRPCRVDDIVDAVRSLLGKPLSETGA